MKKTRSARNGQTLLSPELFWTRVNKQSGDGCWLWMGARSRAGYGHIYASDWYDEQGRRHIVWVKAHRRSWELENGPIPEGLSMCHHCDNPPCVRPSHLFVGTHKDNSDDCARKNRRSNRRGSANPNAKLTLADADAIRRAYRDETKTQTEIGALYGVSQKTVSKIINRHLWRE